MQLPPSGRRDWFVDHATGDDSSALDERGASNKDALTWKDLSSFQSEQGFFYAPVCFCRVELGLHLLQYSPSVLIHFPAF